MRCEECEVRTNSLRRNRIVEKNNCCEKFVMQLILLLFVIIATDKKKYLLLKKKKKISMLSYSHPFSWIVAQQWLVLYNTVGMCHVDAVDILYHL